MAILKNTPCKKSCHEKIPVKVRDLRGKAANP
jgi:hypothetical protein